MPQASDDAPARPGRRRGASGTRPLILKAARELFAEKGFDGTSLRGVARRAGVDPAMVHHFFAGKEALFVEAMEFPVDPARLVPQLLAGPREEIGERVVRTFFALWEDDEARPRMLALLRSAAAGEQGAAMLREFVTVTLLDRVAEGLELPHSRVVLAASQMMGMTMMRFVLEMGPVAEATEDELVELLAPTLQLHLG